MAFVTLGACSPDPRGGHPGDGSGDASPGTADASDPNAGFIDAAPLVDAGPSVDAGDDGAACDKIDILFVIDNSGSMAEEQAALATAFPQFVSVIENYTNQTGQHVDYHIAITTTDITYSQDDQTSGPSIQMWNDGKFVTGNGNCLGEGWPNRRFLQKGDSNLSTAFSCAAHVGTNGSSLEMELEAAKEALIDRVPAPNAGFLREDALLAVVMLTDENDCSTPNLVLGVDEIPCVSNLEPVANYVTALDTLKGGHGRWATAVIAIPPGAGSCGGEGSSENVRLKEFTDAAGANGVFTNICSGNMAESLMHAFDTFGLACENIPPVN